MLLANATDINIWSNYQQAHSQLPRLLRRLIQATCTKIERIGFPTDESVQSGGWDGIAILSEGNEFAPQGFSAWELGATKDIKGKADSDYDKRTKEPLDAPQSEATFIFITPRKWANKDKWAAAKRKEGIWQDVRAYDADDLALWLESAPSVHIWFSHLIGKYPESVTDFVTSWSEWTEATNPPTTAQLLTAGRDEVGKQILDWLHNAPSSIALLGDTQDEARALFLAVLNLLPAEERSAYIARGVIVYDVAVWRQIAASAYPLILIPLCVRIE